MKTADTPILIIIFNRPEKVVALIDALRKVHPHKLFIMADGPRTHVDGDKYHCAQARSIATDIPWDCEIHTYFMDHNLGCDQAVPKGIDWFFSQVDMGIILEDDCIPDPSFFTFCTDLLERYESDERMMHVSGNNFQDGQVRGTGSYYASLYTHSWGWATWRRAWKHYRSTVNTLNRTEITKQLTNTPLSPTARKFWVKHYQNRSYWDALWQYTVWCNNGMSLIPNKNLVRNIGFDAEATHTTSNDKKLSQTASSLDTITHPKLLTIDTAADEYTFRSYFFTPFRKRMMIRLQNILKF